MSKPLTELSDLLADEVSLVDRGANKKKRFPVFKQEEQSTMQDYEEILKAVLEMELDEEAKIDEWVAKAKLDEKAVAALKGALRLLSAHKDVLPKDAIDKLAELAGYPAPKAKAKMPEEEEDKYPTPKAKGPDGKVKKDEGLETLPADVKEKVEAVMKARDDQLSELREANKKVEETLKAERDARELDEWIRKAETDLTHIPGKSAKELGESLKKHHDLDPDGAKARYEELKSMNSVLKQSDVLREAGRMTTEAGAESAWAKIEKLADGVVQKEGVTEITKAQAVRKVLETEAGAALYANYLKENPAQQSGLA